MLSIRSLFAATIIVVLSLFLSVINSGQVCAAPLVTLDPGHGGNDSGAIGVTGLNEKEVNLDIASRVKGLLETAGIRVNMTRSDDRSIGLQSRCDLANSTGADIFVSIHNNYTGDNPAAQGIETYYHNSSGRGKQLADLVQAEIISKTGAMDRGSKSSAFYVLSNTKMTAVLTESAYLSNYVEEEKLRDGGYRQSIAEGIYGGIINYLSQVVGYTVYNPLPQYMRVHVPTITSNTRVQVSTYFAGTKWVSQPVLAPGDYMIRIDPDGFVRSIDSKLSFIKSPDGQNPGVTVYILNPDNRNGADFTSYEWTRNDSYPQGALRWASEGYISFDSASAGVMATSSTGNNISITNAKETLFAENMMLRVHLESVTPWTDIRIPFYWKRVSYYSQKPLPAGDYWIQLGPDPNPGSANTSPYVLSLDGRIPFRQVRLNHNPDPVMAVYIGNPIMNNVGFDVVAFAHNFRRANTYQTMLGALPTGPDNGLGYISCQGVGDPNRASTDFATIPTQALSNGNYIVVTDCGIIRGRVMNAQTGQPLAGARVRIDAIVMVADSNGEFSFTLLVPKSYQLEYAADGFGTQVQVINVKAGQPTYTPWCFLSK